MRWVRAGVLLVAVAAASVAVTAVVRRPVLDASSVLSGARSSATQVGDLTSLLVGCCALVVSVAWCWLVLALGVCTWEALRSGGTTVTAPSLLRPRLVRGAVATCLGIGALTGPAAHAQAPPSANQTSPVDLAAVATAHPVAGLTVLRGLPVPDRVTGGMTSGHSGGHHPGRSQPAGPLLPPSVEVAPGDTLWSLTAGLLPSAAPADAVAAGWPLLYAANREVVGDDPDLLRPGQTLRIGPALARLVRESRAAARPHSPDAGGHP